MPTTFSKSFFASYRWRFLKKSAEVRENSRAILKFNQKNQYYFAPKKQLFESKDEKNRNLFLPLYCKKENIFKDDDNNLYVPFWSKDNGSNNDQIIKISNHDKFIEKNITDKNMTISNVSISEEYIFGKKEKYLKLFYQKENDEYLFIYVLDSSERLALLKKIIFKNPSSNYTLFEEKDKKGLIKNIYVVSKDKKLYRIPGYLGPLQTITSFAVNDNLDVLFVAQNQRDKIQINYYENIKEVNNKQKNQKYLAIIKNMVVNAKNIDVNNVVSVQVHFEDGQFMLKIKETNDSSPVAYTINNIELDIVDSVYWNIYAQSKVNNNKENKAATKPSEETVIVKDTKKEISIVESNEIFLDKLPKSKNPYLLTKGKEPYYNELEKAENIGYRTNRINSTETLNIKIKAWWRSADNERYFFYEEDEYVRDEEKDEEKYDYEKDEYEKNNKKVTYTTENGKKSIGKEYYLEIKNKLYVIDNQHKKIYRVLLDQKKEDLLKESPREYIDFGDFSEIKKIISLSDGMICSIAHKGQNKLDWIAVQLTDKNSISEIKNVEVINQIQEQLLKKGTKIYLPGSTYQKLAEKNPIFREAKGFFTKGGQKYFYTFVKNRMVEIYSYDYKTVKVNQMSNWYSDRCGDIFFFSKHKRQTLYKVPSLIYDYANHIPEAESVMTVNNNERLVGFIAWRSNSSSGLATLIQGTSKNKIRLKEVGKENIQSIQKLIDNSIFLSKLSKTKAYLIFMDTDHKTYITEPQEEKKDSPYYTLNMSENDPIKAFWKSTKGTFYYFYLEGKQRDKGKKILRYEIDGEKKDQNTNLYLENNNTLYAACKEGEENILYQIPLPDIKNVEDIENINCKPTVYKHNYNINEIFLIENEIYFKVSSGDKKDSYIAMQKDNKIQKANDISILPLSINQKNRSLIKKGQKGNENYYYQPMEEEGFFIKDNQPYYYQLNPERIYDISNNKKKYDFYINSSFPNIYFFNKEELYILPITHHPKEQAQYIKLPKSQKILLKPSERVEFGIELCSHDDKAKKLFYYFYILIKEENQYSVKKVQKGHEKYETQDTLYQYLPPLKESQQAFLIWEDNKSPQKQRLKISKHKHLSYYMANTWQKETATAFWPSKDNKFYFFYYQQKKKVTYLKGTQLEKDISDELWRKKKRYIVCCR